MSDQLQGSRPPDSTAGSILREARQARGIHLMALSASLKIAPARLEAMEADRWHELPDAAYSRALAHTVSRALGIDPEPVLRGLPAASQPRLESLDDGLDQPFRDRPTGAAPRLRRYRWSVVALGLVGAVLVWWFLGRWPDLQRAASTTTVGNLVSLPAPAASAPLPPPLAVASGASATSVAPALRVAAQQATWIEIRDPEGQVRLSRLMAAGETIEIEGPSSGSLTVGNAAGTAVWVNGGVIDLSRIARENVARIELR